MWRPSRLVVLLLCSALITPAQERCGAAQDLVNQAREMVQRATANTSALEDAVQLLKQAAQVCPTLGDAWYYRSLVEQKLGQTQKSQFALRQATVLGSEAMSNGLSPFQLATPPAQDKPKIVVGPVRQKWALVVGIGQFASPKPQKLKYAEPDATALAALLKDPAVGRFPAENVRTLIGAEASLKRIKADLNWIAANAASSDLVLIFLASHGSARDKDHIGHLNYIYTHDTDDTDADMLFGSALPMIEVSEIIRSRVRALRTVILLDTCHSGGSGEGILKPSAVSSEAMAQMGLGLGRFIISSSKQNQKAYESDELKHGLFTGFLIEALKQDNGKAPISSLFSYLAKKVPAFAQSAGLPSQIPVMFRSDDTSDLVLGVEPATTGQ